MTVPMSRCLSDKMTRGVAKRASQLYCATVGHVARSLAGTVFACTGWACVPVLSM